MLGTQYQPDGLPNHRHKIDVLYARHGEGGSQFANGQWSNGDWDWTRINPDKYTVYASEDNAIYGNSNYVQPKNVSLLPIIKY